MQPIVYDVAVSLDGYISGPGGDISLFAQDGPVVADYGARLAGYAAAIMGRRTYEFGYAFGLTPGQNPYPHLETLVISRSLEVPGDSAVTVVADEAEAAIRALKLRARGPIYLCGGGALAGWMLDRGLIDRVILKRAPCVYGAGVALFQGSAMPRALRRVELTRYDNGYLLERFVVD